MPSTARAAGDAEVVVLHGETEDPVRSRASANSLRIRANDERRPEDERGMPMCFPHLAQNLRRKHRARARVQVRLVVGLSTNPANFPPPSTCPGFLDATRDQLPRAFPKPEGAQHDNERVESGGDQPRLEPRSPAPAMSPTVFRERGYRFHFFSREESRMHVHVLSGQGEAKYWLEPQLDLAKISNCPRPNCGKSNG